jgi:hypothetical protein
MGWCDGWEVGSGRGGLFALPTPTRRQARPSRWGLLRAAGQPVATDMR